MRAEKTSGTGPSAASDEVTGSGACSRMVWALVPLKPNDEHRRAAARPVSGHGDRLGDQFDGPGRPVDVRGGLVDVQGLGQHAVVQGQDHLR